MDDKKVSESGLIMAAGDSTDQSDQSPNERRWKGPLAAAFYGVASFLIIVINKIVLTNYRFPSPQVLGVGQMLATLLILDFGRRIEVISFPPFTRDVPLKVWPLPLFYVGNLVCGLGGTKDLSLPMFTALRRFTILMTLVGEYLLLNVHPRRIVVATVLSMVGGALVAACDDLVFSVEGYLYVLGNDLFTACNNVYVKKKLESRDLGKYGLLFYNALLMTVPMSVLCLVTGSGRKALNFDRWTDPVFLLAFVLSCIMGFVLMYATVLCTAYNSALTTTIVGCLKNILVMYVGMYIGGDYVFSIANFVGLNISMVGSLAYAYVTFIQTEQKRIPPHQRKESTLAA